MSQLVYVIVPNGEYNQYPALGYEWNRHHSALERTWSVNGKVINREFLYPTKKQRRRIGRYLRRKEGVKL